MAHSLELLFDAETEAAVRRIWDDLAEADLPSRTPPGRPHVTLIAAEHIDAAIDEVLAPVARRLPMRCAIGAPVLFGRDPVVVTRLVVPTRELLELHAEVHRLSSVHLRPMANSLPGQWTAHVTLARRVRGAHLGQALPVVTRPALLDGQFAGLRRWDGDKRIDYLLG